MSGTETPPQRSNVALIVSLCVNLLLAGVIAMAVLRFVIHGPMFMPPRPPGFPNVPMHQRVDVRLALSPRTLMMVAPEHADQIHGIISAHRPRIDTLRGQSFAAREEVLNILKAPAFDKAAFDKALTKMQAADAAVEVEILKVASESAAILTPQERQAAADWRSRHGFGGPFGMGWRHGPQDGPGRSDGPDGEPPPHQP